jgi:GrpB-like predicted nucleotidyltransferase (UPF0157 family)
VAGGGQATVKMGMTGAIAMFQGKGKNGVSAEGNGLLDTIEVFDWSAGWPMKFRILAARLRGSLGSQALRIDHIGSTSVAGLAAKPVVDIQISVASLEPVEELSAAMAQIGFVLRPENPDLTKLYFREPHGEERSHIHMRVHGSWHEQQALLFRDYLRTHTEEHAPYVALKRSLAARFRENRAAYTEGKDEHIWGMLRRADRWALMTGWEPGLSDA